ncbi:MAG: HAMP domain-containing protein [Nitrospirae bacterium]|nr:HAMP domain-containing protein [Nitrospirota bacterium]
MKIRLRLTLLYITITLAIVLMFSLGAYWGMRSFLFRAIDDELNYIADSIERAYDPFFNEFISLTISPDNLNRYLEYYVIVHDTSGNTIFASPMTRIISFEVHGAKDRTKKAFTIDVRVPGNISFFSSNVKGEITFRAISRTMYYKNHLIGEVIVGVPIERIKESMEKLLRVLLGGIVLTLILVGTGSYFLTRQLLNPINKITQKANQISHSNLGERIIVHHKEDELGQLSMVLNSLLGRLQEAFESQKQFMADAAHELKTPLSILRAHWENELNNPGLTLTMKEKLVQDVETISRLSHTINSLLMLSQVEAIQTNFDFTTLQLDELLQEVITDAGMMASIKKQKINIKGLTPVSIQADKMRLYQLFFNLLDNAVKYTDQKGNIDVSLYLESKWAVVEVSDNGIGIPVEDLPHIFERFYRVDNDSTRKNAGSGLGLSICQLIVRSHGGLIEAESEVNAGSTFRVRLPQSV